ncbi:MAG: hypothetical protein RLZ44_1339, partial [Pseudomonadota bacterium]
LDHEYMRAARRSRYDRDVRYYLNGLRVVRELPAPADGVMSFTAAVEDATRQVFSKVLADAPGSKRPTLVIDPVIDGLSGARSNATQAMQSRIVELLRGAYPQFDIKSFSAEDAAASPYVVIGTFTGVNKERKTVGERVAYRICLALLDTTSGKIASKAKVFAESSGVDITPTAFFRDSPVWVDDPSTQAYIKTCQATKPGDPIDPKYLASIRAASLINAAIDAYEQGDYRRSKTLFQRAADSKEGDQLRTLSGLYLTSWKLGDERDAVEAFARLVTYGLEQRRLGVKFPFRPGSTDFLVDASSGGQPNLWLTQIAKVTQGRGDCLEIIGHTQRTGPEMLNQRLSLRRAEYVMRRLAAEAPELDARLIATGRGSEQNLIGSGTDDAKDALDRRISFDAIACTPAE